jgi:post-segregation antitoxin (ccd killing protein)
MTNTLHRYSDHYAFERIPNPEPVQDDYIVFAMASRGINDDNLVEKYRTFLSLALKHRPVNIGDATKGGLIRPRQDMNPTAHWRREHGPDAEQVMAGIDGPTTVAAVFDNYQAMKDFVEELKAADLGISINISAPINEAQRCCWESDISRHSVEYSVGFRGRVDKLPDATTLQLSTMCGHGMVSANFAKKMLEWVKENRRTPEEAARYMARFCICGVFNIARAERILSEARLMNR